MVEEASDPFEELLRSEALMDAACRLPGELLSTYARLWEFETWLRMMVYVELRAGYGDAWENHLPNEGKTGGAQSQDERLSHMPTLERLPTSYMQLRSILSTISDEWCLFNPYLPPLELWKAKVEEVLQVRHRIAHFRRGHKHDADRVAQLLRDLDPGFWRFCLSYNDADWWSSDDAAIREVASHERASDRVELHLRRSTRPWSRPTESFEESPGGFYDAVIHATRGWQFGYQSFLAGTVGVHAHVCLIHVDDSHRFVRVTVPSVIGVSAVADTLRVCRRAAENAVTRWSEPSSLTQHLEGKIETLREAPMPLRAWQEQWVDELAEPYGEFILGPMHMLSFMDSNHLRGKPGSFFAVD